MGDAADAHVLVARCLPRDLEGLGRRDVEEVEGGAALHLDRRLRPVGEHEGRCGKAGLPPLHASAPLVALPVGRGNTLGGGEQEVLAVPRPD